MSMTQQRQAECVAEFDRLFGGTGDRVLADRHSLQQLWMRACEWFDATISTDEAAEPSDESDAERELRLMAEVKEKLAPMGGNAFQVVPSMAPRIAALSRVAMRNPIWERRLNIKLDELLQAIIDFDRVCERLDDEAGQRIMAERDANGEPIQ